MFANSHQSGFLSIFYSVGSNPLALWDKQVKNGHIRRIIDDEVKSLVLDIGGTNVATTYITCPLQPRASLGIKLPFLVMIIKNMKKYFSFEIQILDDKDMRRRFRVSNFQSTTKVRPFCTTMPIGLSSGWNQVQFNLADFTKRAYGSQYMETVRVQIHANVRIRRLYFTDQLHSDEDLPNEFKLFAPSTLSVNKRSGAGKEKTREIVAGAHQKPKKQDEKFPPPPTPEDTAREPEPNELLELEQKEIAPKKIAEQEAPQEAEALPIEGDIADETAKEKESGKIEAADQKPKEQDEKLPPPLTPEDTARESKLKELSELEQKELAPEKIAEQEAPQEAEVSPIEEDIADETAKEKESGKIEVPPTDDSTPSPEIDKQKPEMPLTEDKPYKEVVSEPDEREKDAAAAFEEEPPVVDEATIASDQAKELAKESQFDTEPPTQSEPPSEQPINTEPPSEQPADTEPPSEKPTDTVPPSEQPTDTEPPTEKEAD